MSDDLATWRQWIGRGETREDLAAPFPPHALIQTFDTGDARLKTGDALPPLWHWLYFLDTTPRSKLGPDGLPGRGDFMPPVSLPRRMWAGSRFTFHDAPLKLGDTLRRESAITAIEGKSGSTGEMVFVTVRHRVFGAAGLAVEEEIDGVYREAAKPGETQKAGRPAPTDPTWSKTITPDPVLLFRFSALTFNPHRIHYDQPYTTTTEGYPGLIVHGPLMCLLQVELARRSVPDRKMKSFALRALAPVYDRAPFDVQARREADGSLTTWIRSPDGAMAQQGKAVFA
ncbi:MAG: acyl-CoA dehydrogenase [Alphaproteobacteria bacterium]|nr:acyl-CoA dehydrogenase [Alphaproteobacteria bacterium]